MQYLRRIKVERDYGYDERPYGALNYGMKDRRYDKDFEWMITRCDYIRTELSEMETVLITRNLCGAFLDMRCIAEGEKIEIYYDTAGFILLSEYLENRKCRPSEVLKICVSFLNAAVLCEDYMLSFREVSFRDADVYYSAERSEVRIRYIPGYENKTGIREKLVDIVDSSIKYRDDYSGFIEPLSIYKRKLFFGDHDIHELLDITEECVRSADRYLYGGSEKEKRDQAADLAVPDKKTAADADQPLAETIRHHLRKRFGDLLS